VTLAAVPIDQLEIGGIHRVSTPYRICVANVVYRRR
jgi:hypothetical protein